MTYGIALVFGDSVGEADYWAVNDKLGIARDGSGDWPEGIITHAGGPTATGGWVVMETWESKGHQERFMAGRLGAALGAVGVPAPIQVIDSDLVNTLIR
jgi:hypothetical protein